MKKITILMSLMILLTLVGCTSTPTVTTAQRTQMRTRTMDVDYEVAFRSTLMVLENQGYTIDNTDLDTGLIKATIAKDAFSAAQTFWLGTTGTEIYNMSCTVSKASKESCRIRFNVRLNTETQQGMYNRSSAKEINDPIVYQNLFNELRLEIKRMEAIM